MNGSYSKGTNCNKLWRAWYAILITLLHIFLIYVGITRYLYFKSQAFDPKFGADWDPSGLNFTLAMLISSITFFCMFLFVSVTRTVNYANEGIQIGRDTDNLHLLTPASWRACSMTPGYQLTGPQLMYATPNGTTNHRISTMTGGGNGHAEEDRISAMGTDDTLGYGAQFDTWPQGNPVAQDPLLMPPTYSTNGAPVTTSTRYNSNGSHLSVRHSVKLLWERMQRHFLPYANLLHLLAAYCLLLPVPIVHSQQIAHHALPTDWIWRSDLDVLFGSYEILPSISQSPSAQSDATKSVDLAGRPGTVNPSAQGAILSATSGLDNRPSTWDSLRAMSPEFFNLALALMLLSLRYPSVFWYTNRAFSFIFSLLLLITGLHSLIDFSAASVLIKFAQNQAHLPEPIRVRLVSVSISFTSTASGDSSPSDCLIGVGPLFLSTMAALLAFALFMTVFEYGYRQFTENLAAYRHYLIGSNTTQCPLTNGDLYNGDYRHTHPGQVYTNGNNNGNNNSIQSNGNHLQGSVIVNGPGSIYHPASDSIHSGPNGGNGKLGNGLQGCGSTGQRGYGLGAELLHPACRCCLHNHLPHVLAMLGLFGLLGFKIPVILDCFRVYRLTRHPLMLAAPLSGVVCMAGWLVAWFAFSLKPAWKFQVSLPLHTLTGSSYPVQTNMMGPSNGLMTTTNGLLTSPMTGSLMRQSSQTDGRLYPFSGVPNGLFASYAANPLLTTAGGQLIPPNGQAYNGDDGGSASQLGVPSSPIYACYHDANGIPLPDASRLTVRLASSAGATFVDPSMINSLGLLGVHQGQRAMECFTEDNEASSGRQSGNNYVCLQSALGSNAPNTAVLTNNLDIMNGTIATTTSGTFLMTRLTQPIMTAGGAISYPLPPPPPPLSSVSAVSSMNRPSPPPQAVLSSQSTNHSSFGTETSVGGIGQSASGLMQSPSLGLDETEEDESSTHTVQPSNLRLDDLPSIGATTLRNNRLGPYNTSNTTDHQDSSMGDLSTRDGSLRLSSYAQLGSLNRSIAARSGTISGQYPRVTFKERIDLIDPHSAVITNTVSSAVPSDGSGTYDNTFATSFRPNTMVLCSPTTSATRPRNDDLNMGNMIKLTTATGHAENGRPGSVNGLLNSLSSGSMAHNGNGLIRSGEMIGDANSSFQSSTTDPPPFASMLLTSDLASTTTNAGTPEPRLCSQV